MPPISGSEQKRKRLRQLYLMPALLLVFLMVSPLSTANVLFEMPDLTKFGGKPTWPVRGDLVLVKNYSDKILKKYLLLTPKALPESSIA